MSFVRLHEITLPMTWVHKELDQTMIKHDYTATRLHLWQVLVMRISGAKFSRQGTVE